MCLTTTAGLLALLVPGMGSCTLGRAPAGPSPLGASGESTFFLKGVVTLSKPYLRRLDARWIVVNLSSRFDLKLEVPDHLNERVNNKL